MTATSLSPLLDLPFELRNQIFCELLCPTANEAMTLYRAPHGRPSTLNMHPQILVVSKQVYDEALPLLYSNTYRIDLTSPAPAAGRHGPLPPYAPDLFMSPDVHYLWSAEDRCYPKKGSPLFTKGKMFPYVFRRLRHVVIETADCAVWGRGMWGALWSGSGHLVLEILRCLNETRDAEEEEEDSTRPLRTLGFKFTVTADRYGNHLFASHGKQNEMFGGMKAMLSLLTATGTRRIVTLKTELLSKNRKKLGHIDIEKWVASLK